MLPILVARRAVRKHPGWPNERDKLGFISQALLVTIRSHALAAFMF
jgi:hypothetical protein